jgi:hypothetical protein
VHYGYPQVRLADCALLLQKECCYMPLRMHSSSCSFGLHCVPLCQPCCDVKGYISCYPLHHAPL